VYKILILIALSLNISHAETTGNLLPQQFFNNNQGHGGWNCNDPSHNHGNSTVAAVHGDFIENTITLGDTLNQSQMNGGWTSTFGADMWGWNQYDQEIKMTQTITGADGTVTTQIRNVAIPGCSGYNCSSYSSYTDSYTQGINSQSNYTIKARFDFTESSQSALHRAIDLKNPILTVEYSLLDTTQVAQLKNMSETVYNVVEDIEIIEYIPEEFNFETFYEPTIEFTMLEEINFEPQAVEEINTGIIDVFMETITYDKPETIESFSTEIEVAKEIPIQREDVAFEEEIYQERQTDIQTSDVSGITERQSIQEETSGGESKEVNGVEDSGTGNGSPPREDEERITGKSGGQTENQTSTAVTQTDEDTIVSQGDEQSERSQDDGGRGESNEAVTIRQDSISEERVEETTREDTVSVSIEDIRAEVEKTTASVSQKIVQVNILVAKAMQSPVSIDSYANVNQNIFKDQLNINGGSYESRDYVDDRDIYKELSYVNQDKLHGYKKKMDEAVANKIKAQLELERIINGY